MDQLNIAFGRGFFRGSPRSSNRSNRLPRNGDLGITPPYGVPHKPLPPYDSSESLYTGRQGYFSQYPASRFDWDNAKPIKEPKTFKGVFSRFGTYTSLQGIPFILRAKRWFSRLLWTLLFLTALGLTVWQFLEVGKKFIAKDTSSSIKLGYANLEFPSITVCNINPVRLSAVNQTSDALRAFLESVAPSENYGEGGAGFGEFQPKHRQQQQNGQQPQNGQQNTNGQQSPNGQTPSNGQQAGATLKPAKPTTPQPSGTPQPAVTSKPTSPQPARTPKPAGTPKQTTQQPWTTQPASTPDALTTQTAGTPQPASNPDPTTAQSTSTLEPTAQQPASTPRPGGTPRPAGNPQPGRTPRPGQGSQQGRRKRQTEDDNSDVELDFDKHRPPPGRHEFGSGNASAKFVYKETFYSLLSDLGRRTRLDIGHQRDVLILDCEFNGRQCRQMHWQRILTREHGNCYTFNSVDNLDKPLRSQRAGSQFGLNLILYVEKHEYLKGIVAGRGVRFAVHKYKTIPFVAENGLSVATGTETYVGMKMINIERIGTCGDNGAFEEEYEKSYTVEACVTTCLDRVHIAGDCQCYRQEYFNFYSKKAIASLRPCSTTEDEECISKWEKRDAEGNVKCNCNQECTGITYDMTSSFNHWPDVSMWYSLVDAVCAQSESSCQHLKQTEDHQRRQLLQDNFMAVRIYYRDLNFETIKEELVYEQSQFVADLGGTAGLWVGASVLTFFEVIDLLIQIVMFPCKKRRNVNERRPPAQMRNNHKHLYN